MVKNWEYRLAKDENDTYLLIEVYYNRDGSIGTFTKNGFPGKGSSVEYLKGEVEDMLDAFNKPTLDLNLIFDK